MTDTNPVPPSAADLVEAPNDRPQWASPVIQVIKTTEAEVIGNGLPGWLHAS